MQQDPNYGRSEEERRLTQVPVGGTMSPQDEQTWSMLAHLSVLTSLIIGLFMPFGALIVWLIYKDNSPRVRFHAAQAFWYQIVWTVIWIIQVVTLVFVIPFYPVFMTTYVFVGPPWLSLLLFFVLFFLLWLAPMVHGCYAAYKVSGGVDYRYPIIANLVDRTRRFA